WLAWRPRRVIRRITAGEKLTGAPAELEGMVQHAASGVSAFLCTGTTCAPPARTLAEWEATLRR
ncbi:MAG TPA: hypothetical protein VFI41_13250, partial [Gemmatimonadales bacterium]|nr:hypothetical protein [Gemmatimonadales bacterium]